MNPKTDFKEGETQKWKENEERRELTSPARNENKRRKNEDEEKIRSRDGRKIAKEATRPFKGRKEQVNQVN